MLKDIVLKYVREKPKLRKSLSYVYVNLLKLKFYKRVKLKNLIFVNPVDVKYGSKYFNIYNSTGKVIGGDWDLKNRKKFSEQNIYRGLYEHFVEHKKWEDTVYFKHNLKIIEGGVVLWHCHNKEDLLKRCERLDELYSDIKDNGFYIESQKGKNNLTKKYDFVTVNISRTGEILFNDGGHRLAIAKILKIEKIPVKVLVRHKIWYNYIKNIDKLLLGKPSYQNLGHPDLNKNFRIFHNCEDRWNIIKKNIPSEIKKGKFLDIGSNMGYFSQKFEELGFESYLIEHEVNFINYLKITKGIRGFKYHVIDEDMFEWSGIVKNKFKVTLALSIFHHYLKTETLYMKLKQLLNSLDTECLILETHNTNESQMKGVYKNYTSKEFVNFIKKETGLKKFKKIGGVEPREIFILTK